MDTINGDKTHHLYFYQFSGDEYQYGNRSDQISHYPFLPLAVACGTVNSQKSRVG